MKKLLVLLLSSFVLLTSLTACSDGSEPETPDVPEVKVDETKTADVVVVGAGGAGLAAAIEAVENGAESVLLIEKTATTGGSLNYTSGSMSGAETITQQIDGIEDSKESFIEDIKVNGAGLGNEELIKAFVDEDVDAIQWLWDNGLSDNDFGIGPRQKTMNVFAPEHRLYSQMRTMKPKPDNKEVYKAAAHEVLDTVAKANDKIVIEFNTEAKQLLQNDKGQVLSVVAENDGKTIKYDASKAVIMSTGGFSGNHKMMGNYAEYGDKYLVGGAASADGYGIYMMQQVGANIAEESLSYIPTFPMGLEYKEGYGQIAPTYMWKYGGICVNQEGERFVDETSDSVEERELALEKQTNAIQYDIFTDKIIADTEASKVMNIFWNFMYKPGMKLNSHVIEADSLEELAEKIGVPAENLQTTVDAYNAHVESKEEDEFGRKYTDDALNPAYNVLTNKIDGEKYYAVALKALCVMTLGGVDINTNGQVLDTKGNVIPGLYAAGECVNMWGRFVSGGTGVMGPIVFGRIAARHAMTTEEPLAEGYKLQAPLTLISEDLFVKESNLPTFDMSTPLKDGEYQATVDGQEGPMTVKTVITDGKISAVEILEQHESAFTADAQKELPEAIVSSNSLNVDATSGATFTSTRILQAVKTCLEEASK